MNEILITSVWNSQLASVAGWTLVHFLWQGLLIGVVGWIALKLLARASANSRYLAASGLLALMPITVIGTAMLLTSQLNCSTVAVDEYPTINEAMGFDSGDPAPTVVEERVAEAKTDQITEGDASKALPDSASDSVFAAQSLVEINSQTPLLTFKDRLALILEPILPAMVVLWLAGVLCLSLRLLTTWARVQWIKKTGEPVTSGVLCDSVQVIKRRLGITRAVNLLESAAVEVPTVIGWLKPAILLPMSALTGLSNSQVEAILAHELAHIRRADYIVNLFQSIVETVLFYHPVVWWLSNQLRTERENCCDDFAAQYCGNTKQYAFALLKMEQLRPQTNQLALGANGGSLVNRVARLIGKQPSKNQTPSGIAALSMLTLVLVLAATFVSNFQPPEVVAAAAVQDKAPDGKNAKPKDDLSDLEWPKKVTIKVVDPNGKPLPGVNVHRGVWSKDRTFDANHNGITDDKGEFTTKLPERFYILRLWARGDGYIPLFANWEEQDITRGELPPKNFTFKMIAGTEIGGFVKNDKGKAIVGAKVEVRCSTEVREDIFKGSGPRLSGTLAYGSAAAVTDENGFWNINNAPKESAEFTVTVRHPEYIDDSRPGELQKIAGLESTDFRNRTGVIVMPRGVRVTGTLKNSDGDPIDQALVVFGDAPYMDQGSQEVKTNSKGVFEFPPLPMGKLRVTVMAEGYRPETQVVEVTHMMDPVDFEMVGGETIKIKFVDQEGKPIPEVYVGVKKWRGVESIYNHQHPNVIDSKIPIQADANGVYIWNWAPEDEVTFTFGQLGYVNKRGVTLSAADKEHVVKLYTALSISGDVVDKTTGKRIKDFTVVPWSRRLEGDDPKRKANEMRWKAKPSRNGRFSIDLDSEAKFQLKIQAEGYEIAESDWYKVGETVPRLKIELEPNAWLEGHVVDKSGAPIAEAEIQLASAEKTISLRNYKPVFTGIKKLLTDADGNFKMPRPDQPYTLTVLGEKGYVEVVKKPGEDIGEIVVPNWGRIEGTVFNEQGKPAVNVKVCFDGIRYQHGTAWHIQDLSVVTTNKKGKYFFARVPAGMDVAVSPLHHMTDQLKTKTNKPISIEAGKTYRVDFGKGVEVTGLLKLNGSSIENVGLGDSKLVTRPTSEPDFRILALSKYWNAKTQEESSVEIYERVNRGVDIHVTTAINKSLNYWDTSTSYDGSFRMMIDEAGNYETLVYVYAHDLERKGIFGAPMGRKVIKFTVTDKDLKSGKLDLGTIEVQAKLSHELGEAILDFDFENQEGGKRRISDFKDQYVLIDFYAPWCAVCKNDTERVKGLVETIQKKGLGKKITVLSLEGLGGSGSVTRAPAGSKSGWINGKLYPESSQKVLTSLGVWSMPRYLLIDSERKLLYHGAIDGVEKELEQIK